MESSLLGFTTNRMTNFPIVNFSFLSSSSPSAPTYGVYFSQFIRYAGACSEFKDSIEQGRHQRTKQVNTYEVLWEES